MYENPETALEEFETSQRLVDYLDARGFDTTHPAYGLDTAFAARVGSEGPEIVICAEMDALPEVGHACGHNIIATAALGAGAALAPLAEELGIRLTVLGTPAEERWGGKAALIEAGAFADAACAMMIHPAPADVVDPKMFAVADFEVEYHGKPAHASAYPEKGINALDAFVQAYVSISTMRQSLLSTERIHGIITHGGDAPNIVPAFTKSAWAIRAGTREELGHLEARVRACWEAAASATGCSLEVTAGGSAYDELRTDPLLADLYSANSQSLGRPMARVAELSGVLRGSTDMGNVSRVVPTIHPMVSIHPGEAVNHQPEFAAHTITADGQRAILDGATAMALTVVDLAEGDRWSELGAAL
ncbi:MAG: amidohydrolase [Acidimicrobiia bacterium]|nr:amidohydrolase [Acidimicrobiia bacterium]